MLNDEISRVALSLPPEDRLALVRLLLEGVVEPELFTDAVKQGIKRIEDVATGKIAGLTEQQYRAVVSWTCERDARAGDISQGNQTPGRG